MQLPKLSIGNLVSKIPIIQGGMGVGISLSGLASAVANEGGIGVIAAAILGIHEPDYLKNSDQANIRVLKNEISASPGTPKLQMPSWRCSDSRDSTGPCCPRHWQ